MMIIINMCIQLIVAYVTPFLIIESLYNKKGKVYSIIIVPFFLLNWILQALVFIPALYVLDSGLQYANVLWKTDTGAMIDRILLWINDFCVFLFPVICDITARRLSKDEEKENEKNDEQNIETEDNIILDDMNNKKLQPQFCRVCGHDIKENSNYCRKCGQKIWDGELNDL